VRRHAGFRGLLRLLAQHRPASEVPTSPGESTRRGCIAPRIVLAPKKFGATARSWCTCRQRPPGRHPASPRCHTEFACPRGRSQQGESDSRRRRLHRVRGRRPPTRRRSDPVSELSRLPARQPHTASALVINRDRISSSRSGTCPCYVADNNLTIALSTSSSQEFRPDVTDSGRSARAHVSP
jgi:hypothetical protein